jgi:hypothetical protein
MIQLKYEALEFYDLLVFKIKHELSNIPLLMSFMSFGML